MAKPETKYDKDPRPAVKCIPVTVGLALGRKDDKRRRKATREHKPSNPTLTGLTQVAWKAIQTTIQTRLPPHLRKEDHLAVASSSSHSSNGTRRGEGVATRGGGRASTRAGDKRERLSGVHGVDDGSDDRVSKRSRKGERVPADPLRLQTAEKRKRPAENCGADAGSDSRSSKKMRDDDRAPTRDGVRPLIATRSAPSESVLTARTSTARPSTARPSTLSRAAAPNDVPARRTSAIRTPTHSRAAPSAPATRAPTAPVSATGTSRPVRPAPSKAHLSLDVRDDVSSSKTARKNIADATKLRSEEKRCFPKENVSSLKEGGDPLDCLFEPGLAFSSTNEFLRLFVKKAQMNKDFKYELIERCWYIIDKSLSNKTIERVRAAKLFEDLGHLPWPFLRRLRAKVLYTALDKGTPLKDFAEACRRDVAELKAADVDQ